MNKIRDVIGTVFSSPMREMSFVAYFSYLNGAGKLTARTLMDMTAILLTYVDEQEKKNEQFEANFKDIAEILNKLVDQKVDSPLQMMTGGIQKIDLNKPLDVKEFEKPLLTTDGITKEEAKKRKQLENLAKARAVSAANRAAAKLAPKVL